MNNIDIGIFKKILLVRLRDSYYNVDTKRINKTAIKNKISQEDTGINIKYKLIGNLTNIIELSEYLTGIISKLLIYNPNDISHDLLITSDTILCTTWIENLKTKYIAKNKKSSLISTKKFIIGLNILAYFYTLYTNSLSIEICNTNILLSYTNIINLLLYININNINVYPDNYNINTDYNSCKNIILAMNKSKDYISNIIKPSSNILVEEYLKTKKIVNKEKKLRYSLWFIHYGDTQYGECFSCLKSIEIDDPSWHCGHIISNANGGAKELGNTRPVCVKCNLDMSKQHMYQYMIYNNKLGCKNLVNDILDDNEIVIIDKYKNNLKIYNKRIECINILEETKILPKAILKWWRNEIKTDSTDHLNIIKSYLESKLSL